MAAGFTEHAELAKTMESLISKIESVEAEAAKRVAQAEAKGKEAAAKLSAAEESILSEVQETAEAKGKDITKEAVKKAHAETNALHQDEDASLATIQKGAADRRADVVAFAVSRFKELYL